MNRKKTDKKIKQDHYPTLIIDTTERDIVQIWQKGDLDREMDVAMIEKDKLVKLIKTMSPETRELILNLFSLWDSLAKTGEIRIGSKFADNYKDMKEKLKSWKRES